MGFSASFSMLHLDPILQELRHTRWASRKQTLTASNGLPDFFDLKEAADLGSEPRFHLSRRETQLEAGTPSESADPSAQPTRRQPSLAKMKFFGH